MEASRITCTALVFTRSFTQHLQTHDHYPTHRIHPLSHARTHSCPNNREFQFSLRCTDSRACPELVRHSGQVDAMFEAWRSRSQSAYVRSVTCALEWLSSLDFFCSAASSTIGVRSEDVCLFLFFLGSAKVLGVIVQSARNGFLFLIRVVHFAIWFTIFDLRFFLVSEAAPRQLGIRHCLLMFFTARMLQRSFERFSSEIAARHPC